MKLTKLFLLFLFLSLKGFSQQFVLTSSGEKVVLSSTGDAGTLTGTTLKSTVLASSLTSVGTLTSLTVSNTLTTNSGINNTGTIINNGKLIVGASSAASASAILEASSTTQGFLPPRMNQYQRNSISSIIAGLVVWCSNCGSNGELQVYNGTSWTNMIGGAASVVFYTIGESVLGGKIAYILQSGDPGYVEGEQHGLVATVADISTAAIWGCEGTTISGADGTAIGTGNQNTIDIMAGCPTAGIAARLAGDLVQGGYSDWYLPSKDELYKLYINRVAIGGFENNFYWSSTENDNNYAWLRHFVDGSPYISLKNNTNYVRAIRAF